VALIVVFRWGDDCQCPDKGKASWDAFGTHDALLLLLDAIHK
jgi:hypothetical protein